MSKDAYGYTWLVSTPHERRDGALVTDLHAVNSALETAASARSCCARWSPSGTTTSAASALVYLYKRGTFYPFAPLGGGNSRDNALELQVKGVLGDDLRIEQDLTRWFPVWGAPGL